MLHKNILLSLATTFLFCMHTLILQGCKKDTIIHRSSHPPKKTKPAKESPPATQQQASASHSRTQQASQQTIARDPDPPPQPQARPQPQSQGRDIDLDDPKNMQMQMIGTVGDAQADAKKADMQAAGIQAAQARQAPELKRQTEAAQQANLNLGKADEELKKKNMAEAAASKSADQLAATQEGK